MPVVNANKIELADDRGPRRTTEDARRHAQLVFNGIDFSLSLSLSQDDGSDVTSETKGKRLG